MLIPKDTIYLACGATDMRKSINGLSALVTEQFKLSPFEPALFVFCNRNRDRIKILFWEDNGFWLYLKRLEKGHFMWPSATSLDATISLSYEELSHLLNSPFVASKLKGTAFVPT